MVPASSLQADAHTPEQRVRCAFQRADHRPDAAPFNQPTTRTGFPLAAGITHERVKLTRAAPAT